MLTRFEALFVLIGLSLVIVGRGDYPALAGTGGALIALALLGRWRRG